MNGQLYIVATPIGNLDDISFRAIEVLKSVDRIAAEDTRHSQKLLQHFGIQTSMLALHDHNEEARAHKLIKQLLDGENIALISDAGTPLISDPGYRLVSMAQDAGVRISPIPGACAVITALSASGLPTDRFYFEGFLPAKTQARKMRIGELGAISSTVIVYESCHRILACLKDMLEVLGDSREVCLAKELTKQYEMIKRGNLPDLLAWIQSDDKLQQGEFVLLIKGETQKDEALQQAETVLSKLMPHLPLKTAASLASDITGVNKNTLYQLALSLKK
jgi:16S rRNA (cytidine1402-2'-O)-methyltransferase